LNNGRRKFNERDRGIGNNKKGSFWGCQSTIIRYWVLTDEYIVCFDDGKEEYVNYRWLKPHNIQAKN
jgi:hypothetical protein